MGFEEKPNARRALELLANGNYLWNAGIFLCRVDTILAAFEAHAPQMIAPAKAAWEHSAEDLGFVRLGAKSWAMLSNISVDYAIMERADNLSVQRFSGAWSDLGSWEAILREDQEGEDGVRAYGGGHAMDCKDTLIYRAGGAPQVVGLGLDHMIVVATKDAILVADRGRAEQVKDVVAQLEAQGEAIATQSTETHRPWGWYDTLVLGNRFQVKRIVVKPGGILSLQSHHHRAEHWVVVEGTARVTIEAETKIISENQSVYIPLGARHRLENPGKLPMVLIEIQTGGYLGEDDIIRYHDHYNRGDADLSDGTEQ